MELDGRSAVVTGGAGGLGAATVRRLVARGVGVVIFDQNELGAATLADELGDRAVAATGDINDDDDVGAALDAATVLGPLSIVVNVAGGATGAGRLVDRHGNPHSKDVFVDTMQMNAIGTFNVSRLGAAVMAQNDPTDEGERGVIVNTASIAGLEGQTGQIAYAATKAAILGMTLPIARDLAPSGIRCCAIAPGTMGTPLMLSAPEEMQAQLTANIIYPKRMGYPDEFGQLVESIVDNTYLNGENIRLDGALRFPPK